MLSGEARRRRRKEWKKAVEEVKEAEEWAKNGRKVRNQRDHAQLTLISCIINGNKCFWYFRFVDTRNSCKRELYIKIYKIMFIRIYHKHYKL